MTILLMKYPTSCISNDFESKEKFEGTCKISYSSVHCLSVHPGSILTKEILTMAILSFIKKKKIDLTNPNIRRFQPLIHFVIPAD